MLLIPGVVPRLLARTGLAGREKVVMAFTKYFASQASDTGSPLVKARSTHLMNEIDLEDVARLECVNGLAILLNSVPSAFWTIIYIYGNPKLLRTVRSLVQKAIITTSLNTGEAKVISLSGLRAIPQFNAIIQEAIRLRTTGVGPRLIREDVLLQDRYLLKKDSYVMFPNHDIHIDKDIWGPSVDHFDEERFLKAANSHRMPMAAFRGFGGGATLCPGKHFAIAEIAAFIAILAINYDIHPIKGDWSDLDQDMTDMSLQLGSPKGSFPVEFIRRHDTLSTWSFTA